MQHTELQAQMDARKKEQTLAAHSKMDHTVPRPKPNNHWSVFAGHLTWKIVKVRLRNAMCTCYSLLNDSSNGNGVIALRGHAAAPTDNSGNLNTINPSNLGRTDVPWCAGSPCMQ